MVGCRESSVSSLRLSFANVVPVVGVAKVLKVVNGLLPSWDAVSASSQFHIDFCHTFPVPHGAALTQITLKVGQSDS